MTYNKPYHFFESARANKHIMLYKTKERKTKRLTFMRAHRLPYDSGNSNLSYTLVDPKDYDLIYYSAVPEGVFLPKYDVLPNNGVAPLVNEKVKEILEALCPEDVQFFPVVIKNENDKVKPFQNYDYWLLNICSLYEDVDFDQSVLDYSEKGSINEGLLRGYKKCVFNELNGQKIPHISRLVHFEPCIIVSPELVKILKKEKIKGVKFIKDEDYPL